MFNTQSKNHQNKYYGFFFNNTRIKISKINTYDIVHVVWLLKGRVLCCVFECFSNFIDVNKKEIARVIEFHWATHSLISFHFKLHAQISMSDALMFYKQIFQYIFCTNGMYTCILFCQKIPFILHLYCIFCVSVFIYKVY